MTDIGDLAWDILSLVHRMVDGRTDKQADVSQFELQKALGTTDIPMDTLSSLVHRGYLQRVGLKWRLTPLGKARVERGR